MIRCRGSDLRAPTLRYAGNIKHLTEFGVFIIRMI